MLVRSSSTHSFARAELGGKGYNLYLMTNQNLPVPQWVALGSRIFREFRTSGNLNSLLKEKVSGAIAQKNFAEAANVARETILSVQVPESLQKLIRAAIAELGDTFLAVRSSAAEEDSHKFSFAGQLSTFLYVKGEVAVLDAVRECWASAYSERALSYRMQSGIPVTTEIDMAVVIQKMIPSEKSGVLFTVDPVSENPDLMTISSVFGLGEGLVSGLLAADTFTVRRSKTEIVGQEIAEKNTALQRAPEGGCVETAVPQQLVNTPSLTSKEISDLAELAHTVERFYKVPQDVEWTIADGNLYLLQSRPITTLKKQISGTLHIWDNSNIIESYGGITLPLTFTFAKYVYSEVYLQFCKVLHVPAKEIRSLQLALDNMLGSISGRVYYNLLNWYRLLTIVPGFKANRAFMETMMGVGESLSEEIAERCHPDSSHFLLRAKVGRIFSGFKLIYFHFEIQNIVDTFLRRFKRVLAHYRAIPYFGMPADEIYTHFRALENDLLRKWEAPIINDFLCMVHFGILKKLTQKWLSDLDPSVQNDLLAADGHLESAEPTRELIRMAGVAAQNPALKELLESSDPKDTLEALNQSQHKEFYDRVQSYIHHYGFRCMNEMKLEQPDLHQDASFLFVCIRNYLRGGQIDLTEYEKREKAIRAAAEEKVWGRLTGLRRIVYQFFLTHTRKAVRNRENTRFCRTRVYGVVRAMFFAIGEDFAKRGMIATSSDIFYITLPELYGTLNATLTGQDLLSLVAQRKKEYDGYQNIEPAPRFLTRGLPYVQNDHFSQELAGPATATTCASGFGGIGCSPGIIEGTVKVILNPTDSLDLNGEILVTLRTDPGWIPLYPAAKGLLVERGSLLSHSAVVAREMGLPTIVSIKGLTKTLHSGMRVRMNGSSGEITILDSNNTGNEGK